jgi:two-component system sensor histidine kinase MtrB
VSDNKERSGFSSIWRRNLRLRLVTVTIVASSVVLGVLGIVLLERVTGGILSAKEASVLSEATAAQLEVQRLLDASDTGLGPPNVTRLVDSAITVVAVRAGSTGSYDALLLAGPEMSGMPERGTRLVSEKSIPAELRTAINESGRQAWTYSLLTYEDGQTKKGIVVGAPVTIPRVGGYELYLLFPLTAEQQTLSLVRGGVGATGTALLVGLALLAWFVTSRVTGPIRKAAQVAGQLASGNLDQRLEVRGEDDLARLATSFNNMAESLKSQINRLEHLSTLQQQFVSDVSHELRTPLTTVRMASEMIFDARKSLDPEIARSAELLRNQVDRFDLLLSDLLEMSKIDAGATVLNVTNFDLAELLSTEIEAASEIAKKHQTNIILYQSEVKTFVEADTRRICRIIRNLITNAVEHSESKSIEVTIKSNDSAISIGVRDYGQGMNTEDIGRVFDRFWRADPARKRTLGGTGLGLSISIEDAKLHSGDLAAWAAPGKGAHFVLTLPIRPNLEIVDPPIKAGPK